MISLIVAASVNNVIGVGGRLPWHLPDDLGRFRELTLGKPVIMGRRTFESIGHALPGRQNIVVTRQPDFVARSCVVVGSPEAAIALCRDGDEIMIIGGGEIYAALLPRADRVYLTRVNVEIDGDTRLPQLREHDWRRLSREPHSADARHAHEFEFLIFDRITRPNP